METRLIYLKETLQVHGIFDGEGSISHYPDAYGVISGDANEVLKTALVLNIDLNPIFDFFITNNILPNMTTEKLRILKDRAFGIQFAVDIIDRIKNQDTLTLTQRGTLLSKIHLFLTVLTVGDVVASRAIFNNYAVDTILTQGRKDWVLNQLDAYLIL